jgi:hypothetical protein
MASALNYLQGVSADDVSNGSALIKLECLLDKHDVEKLKPVLSYFRRNDRASLIKITPVLKEIFNPLRAAASARNCTMNTHVAVTNPAEYDTMFGALDLNEQRVALYELPKTVIPAVQKHNGSAAAMFVTRTKGASVTTTRGLLGAAGMGQAMKVDGSVVMQQVQKMAQNSTVQEVSKAVNSWAGMDQAIRDKDSVLFQKAQVTLVEDGIAAVAATFCLVPLLQTQKDRGKIVQQLLPHAEQVVEQIDTSKKGKVCSMKAICEVLYIGTPKGEKAFGCKGTENFVPSAVEVAKLMLAKFNSDMYTANDIDDRSVQECAVETIEEFNKIHTSNLLRPKQFRDKRKQSLINQSSLRINNDDVDAIIVRMTSSLTREPQHNRCEGNLTSAIYKAIIQAGKLTQAETTKLDAGIVWIRNRYRTLKKNKEESPKTKKQKKQR